MTVEDQCVNEESLMWKIQEGQGTQAVCCRNTHCVSLCLLPTGSSPCHHWLHHSHPALFVWKTGGHEVDGLTGPARSMTTGLQLQDIRNVWYMGNYVKMKDFRIDSILFLKKWQSVTLTFRSGVCNLRLQIHKLLFGPFTTAPINLG